MLSVLLSALKFFFWWGIAYLIFMLLASVIIWKFTLNPGDLNTFGRVVFVFYMLCAIDGAMKLRTIN